MMVKFYMDLLTAKLQDLCWNEVNVCSLATLKVSYCFNGFLMGRRFVYVLFEWKLRTLIDNSILHIAVSTEEALEVLRP